MKITDSVTIDRPIDEVFAYAGDPNNDPQWSTAFVDVHVTSGGPIAKGSTLTEQARFLGKNINVECEITEYEPGQQLAFNIAVGSNTGVHVRTFEAVEGGTQVTMLTEGDSTGLFKFADPVVGKLMQRQLTADLHVLKATVESS